MAQGEWKKTTALIDAAAEILAAENPMTVRQLFYRLVSSGAIANNRGDYQRVSVTMTTARMDGRVSFDHIVDRSRSEYVPNVFDDPAEYADIIKDGYRKDYWKLQPNHVEIWVEKDSVTGSILSLTDELGIGTYPARGFNSTSKVHEAAERLASTRKHNFIFYLGDHDPSGRSCEESLRDRVLGHGSGPFAMQRLAIHAADIARFKLPPLRVKPSDPRAGQFLRKYANRCVELDALPPTELRRRIREAVEGLLDRELWDRAVAVEKVEIASIVETVSRWPGAAESLES